jgi:hypothetical protein
MTEFVTILVGLPIVYFIGEFYFRLGMWLYQLSPQARRPVIEVFSDAGEAEIAALPDDSRYAVALNTATALIIELTRRPDMSPPEKLSTVTFGILDAMGQVGKQPYRREQRLDPVREMGWGSRHAK